MDKQTPKQGKNCQRYLFLPVTVRGDARKKLAMRIPFHESPKGPLRDDVPLTLKFNTVEKRSDVPIGKFIQLKQSPAVSNPGKSAKTWTMWRVLAGDHKEKICRLKGVTTTDPRRMLQLGLDVSSGSFRKPPTPLYRGVMGTRGTLKANVPEKSSRPHRIAPFVDSLEITAQSGSVSLANCSKMAPAELSMSSPNVAEAKPQVFAGISERKKSIAAASTETSRELHARDSTMPVANSPQSLAGPIDSSACNSPERRCELLPNKNRREVSRLAALAVNALLQRPGVENSVSQSCEPVSRDKSNKVDEEPTAELEFEISNDSNESLRERCCVSPESGIDCDEDYGPRLSVSDGSESSENPSVVGKKGRASKQSSPDRGVHSFLERKRRKELKGSFMTLRNMIPELKHQDKVSKVLILKKGREHCLSLRVRELALLSQKVGLIGRRQYLQQILKYLQNDGRSDCARLSLGEEKLPFSLESYDEFVRLLLSKSEASSGLRRAGEGPSDSPCPTATYPRSLQSLWAEAHVASTAGSSQSSGPTERDDEDEEVDVVGLEDIVAAPTANKRGKHCEVDGDDMFDIANDLRIVSVHSLAGKRSAVREVGKRCKPLPKCSRLYIRKLKGRTHGMKRVLMVRADYTQAGGAFRNEENEPPIKKFQRMAEETDILINEIDSSLAPPVDATRDTAQFHRYPVGGYVSYQEEVSPERTMESGTELCERHDSSDRHVSSGSETRFAGNSSSGCEEQTVSVAHSQKRDTGDRPPAAGAVDRGRTQNGSATCSDSYAAAADSTLPCPPVISSGIETLHEPCIKAPASEDSIGSAEIQSRTDWSCVKQNGGTKCNPTLNGNAIIETEGSPLEAGVTSTGDSNETDTKSHADLLFDDGKLSPDYCSKDLENLEGVSSRHVEDQAEVPQTSGLVVGQYREEGESLLEGDDFMFLSAFGEEDQSPFVDEDLSDGECTVNGQTCRFSCEDCAMSPIVRIGRINITGNVALASTVKDPTAPSCRSVEKGGCSAKSLRGDSKSDRISELRQKLKQKEADLEKLRESMCLFNDISR